MHVCHAESSEIYAVINYNLVVRYCFHFEIVLDILVSQIFYSVRKLQ